MCTEVARPLCTRNPWAYSPANPHLLDHASLISELINHMRCHCCGDLPRTAKPNARAGIADRPEKLGVQPGDDVPSSAGRGQDREPGVEEKLSSADSEIVGISGNCSSRYSAVTRINLS